ncbi:flavodoxin-dependent (E)-4-hydroxy-3-methylbut-2-enyl-diphosphate synthase [bacterium]|nr:flavodoxin-dependent (E)-4-hydroxy-3-methylbut-2-enyl-diphosphate synthase [bacterium]
MDKTSRVIHLGCYKIGGDNPPQLQTMITTPLSDIKKAKDEVMRVWEMGCPIVRSAIRSISELDALAELADHFPGALIADIHYDYRLALGALDTKVKGIRINPGNIGGEERVRAIVEKAKLQKDVAIRIGVNAGSLEEDILKKYGGPTGEALVESTLRWTNFFEKELNFFNFKVSAKSSSVTESVKACLAIRKASDVPIHAGITEAGGGRAGIIKSSAGMAILFHHNVVDTFRVSLTAPVEEELRVGFQILKSMGRLNAGGEIISCPTCGRTHGALFAFAHELEELFDKWQWWKYPSLKVAVMGCEVNGPGEARDADIGMALGHGTALYFEDGDVVKRFSSHREAFDFLVLAVKNRWNIL